MSRTASTSIDTEDETCPVCKTTRYFNKDMEFRINPECYHRMCKTCVERIFRDGPNQCPYAGCHKTLRLRGFKTAFFADLSIEREVDIRRRVAAVFNKAEDDFQSLTPFNDYLDMVETLTDELVNGDENTRAKAQARLADWEAQHRADIERNKRLARESDEARQRRLTAESEAARARRQADLAQEAADRAHEARLREEMLDSLTTAETGHASEALNRVMLKKRGQHKQAPTASSTAGLSIRGLRTKASSNTSSASANKPYDPFGGLSMAPSRVDVSLEALGLYHSEWVDAVRSKDEFRVGGYLAEEYVGRALFEAFSGLGIDIAEEKGMSDSTGVSTAGAKEVALTGHTTAQLEAANA
ncbi:hypothetical protein CDD81_351 [Ophiocordyceps australis]|uniref:RNA polymerase II transcription factor B subunit 3 n=1 Tax=Ophiocordyceps australis TaxID=1399860 RepID=A0A2C5Y1B1_9HYPO|nr:hypothetical protein CDD81_351 [Ophiocordyceps australis]